MSTTEEREAYQGDAQDFAHKQSLRTSEPPQTLKPPHVPAAFINCIADSGTKAEAVVYLQQTWNELQEANRRIQLALAFAIRYGQIDGEHHKTWVIDQVVRTLLADKYDATIAASNAGEDGPNTYEWDTGIAP